MASEIPIDTNSPTMATEDPGDKNASSTAVLPDATPGVGPVPPLPAAVRQGNIEDLPFMSLDSTMQLSIDHFTKLLRPQQGHTESNSLGDRFPMNYKSRYLRFTTSAMPNLNLLPRWHLPLGAIICPFAEAPDGEEVPVVCCDAGMICCKGCQTFLNPYVTLSDDGRNWKCNICAFINDDGERVHLAQRPEMRNGSVEVILPADYEMGRRELTLPAEYEKLRKADDKKTSKDDKENKEPLKRQINPPIYLFIIDVSESGVKSCMLKVVAHTIKSCLDHLSNFPGTRIGFMLFASQIQWYKLKSSKSSPQSSKSRRRSSECRPQLMVIPEINEVYLPSDVDLLLAELSESRKQVDYLLEVLPWQFHYTTDSNSAFGPALKMASLLFVRADKLNWLQFGGKLIIFQSAAPSLGFGSLRLHKDDAYYGSDIKHTSGPFYKEIATIFGENRWSIDIYCINDQYDSVAVLGTLPKYTGGQLYYYPSTPLSACDQEKLSYELRRNLTRDTAWEACMRIRCGRGVGVKVLHGYMIPEHNNLVSLGTANCDKAYAAHFCLEKSYRPLKTYFSNLHLYTSHLLEKNAPESIMQLYKFLQICKKFIVTPI